MNLLRRLSSFVSNRSIPERIDLILAITLWLGLAVMLVLMASVVHAWFISNRRATSQGSKETPEEPRVILWVFATTGIVSALFWMGYTTFLDESVAPGDAYDIQTLSDRGVWTFTYPTGKISNNELVVPIGRPVRLILSSKDIPHGLYIPQLRLQQVALPGRYTTLWFKLSGQQTMRLQCTEGCLRGQAREPSLSAVSESHFDTWLSSNERLAATIGGR